MTGGITGEYCGGSLNEHLRRESMKFFGSTYGVERPGGITGITGLGANCGIGIPNCGGTAMRFMLGEEA